MWRNAGVVDFIGWLRDRTGTYMPAIAFIFVTTLGMALIAFACRAFFLLPKEDLPMPLTWMVSSASTQTRGKGRNKLRRDPGF